MVSGKQEKKKGQTPCKRMMPNMEFELQINFNESKCWALYEIMVRSNFYHKVFPDRKRIQLDYSDKGSTLDDCFR